MAHMNFQRWPFFRLWIISKSPSFMIQVYKIDGRKARRTLAFQRQTGCSALAVSMSEFVAFIPVGIEISICVLHIFWHVASVH